MTLKIITSPLALGSRVLVCNKSAYLERYTPRVYEENKVNSIQQKYSDIRTMYKIKNTTVRYAMPKHFTYSH